MRKRSWGYWIQFFVTANLSKRYLLFKLTKEEQKEFFFSKLKKPEKKELIRIFCLVLIPSILLFGIAIYFWFIWFKCR